MVAICSFDNLWQSVSVSGRRQVRLLFGRPFTTVAGDGWLGNAVENTWFDLRARCTTDEGETLVSR